MSVWLIRAGKHGEREEIALNEDIAAIGWEDMPDMTSITSKDELKDLYMKTYPEKKKMAAANHIGQLWTILK